MKILLCVLALLGTAFAAKSYAGYQVLQTEVLENLNAVRRLSPLQIVDELDFWQEPHVGGRAVIMAPRHLVAPLRFTLASMGLRPTLLIPDVETVIQRERDEINRLRSLEKAGPRVADFTRFYDFNEIQAYLDDVVANFPSIASIINIGTSYNGLPMRVLKLSNGPGKSAIFFDSAIHAREWMGPPTVMWAIDQLTANLAQNQAYLDNNDFYFLPVANPDGYSFTWDTNGDRLWRKTRSPNAGSNCIGTDPNRNFDQNWAGAGAGSPCSETYAGSGPFSEPETQAISAFVASQPSITFAQSVHSYGQYLLHPYGDTTALPPNVADLTRVGEDALAALQAVAGTRYTLGSVANVLYEAYGSSTDWSYVQQNIMLSYTIELPGGGLWGFNPPPSDIIPVCTETWEAYKVFFQNIPATRG